MTYFTEKQTSNNKAKRIFETADTQTLFNPSKVALHAYETKTKFTIYVHENIDVLFVRTDADTDAEFETVAQFKVNPHYEKRDTDSKYKNEKFSRMLSLDNIDFTACTTDADKQTARNNALNDLLAKLSARADLLVKRKADADAQTSAQQTQTSTDAQQTADSTQTATDSAQTQTDATASTDADKQTADAQTDAQRTADATASKTDSKQTAKRKQNNKRKADKQTASK